MDRNAENRKTAESWEKLQRLFGGLEPHGIEPCIAQAERSSASKIQLNPLSRFGTIQTECNAPQFVKLRPYAPCGTLRLHRNYVHYTVIYRTL